MDINWISLNDDFHYPSDYYLHFINTFIKQIIHKVSTNKTYMSYNSNCIYDTKVFTLNFILI